MSRNSKIHLYRFREGGEPEGVAVNVPASVDVEGIGFDEIIAELDVSGGRGEEMSPERQLRDLVSKM